ncbi:MAG: WD40 repeat domain-containing protein [Microbacteriaceae bacterium]
MTPTVTAFNGWAADVDDAVAAVSPGPDGRIAVAGSEGSLTLLSPAGEVESRQVLSMGCLAVAWSPAGGRIAVGCIDGVVIVDAAGDRVARYGGGWCSSLAWSFDGARLAAGVGKSSVVYRADGAELFRHTRDSTVTTVDWINRRVASAAYGGVHVCHVSMGAGPDILPFTGSLLTMAISPDRRWAASGNQDATLHVWRVGKAGEELSMSGYPTKISALAFSPDSMLLASGGGQDVTVWDFGGRGPRGSTPRILAAHQQAVTGLAWSPGGEMLAAVAGDGCVALWEPRSGVPGQPLAPVERLDGYSPASAVCWVSPDQLVAAWADGTVAAHRVR